MRITASTKHNAHRAALVFNSHQRGLYRNIYVAGFYLPFQGFQVRPGSLLCKSLESSVQRGKYLHSAKTNKLFSIILFKSIDDKVNKVETGVIIFPRRGQFEERVESLFLLLLGNYLFIYHPLQHIFSSAHGTLIIIERVGIVG